MPGIGEAVATDLKLVRASGLRMAKGVVRKKTVLPVLVPGARLLPLGDGLRDPREQSPFSSSTSATAWIADEVHTDRHHRPHARLPARDRQTGAGTRLNTYRR